MIITVELWSFLHRRHASFGAFECRGLLLQSSDNELGLFAADPVKYSATVKWRQKFWTAMSSLFNKSKKKIYPCGGGKWHITWLPLSLKQLVIFFSKNMIIFSNVIPDYHFCMELIQCDEYLVNTVDTDGLVIYDHGKSTRASVPTVLHVSTHLYITRCLWVNSI